MARKYSVVGNGACTQSATLPLITLISGANVRPKLFDVLIGSGASPVDQQARFILQRCTAAGTPGSAITPQALDPADPPALASSGLAVFSVGPTLTANTFLLQLAGAMRASLRWVAKEGSEIVLPATASNGVALMPVQVSAAWDAAVCLHYAE